MDKRAQLPSQYGYDGYDPAMDQLGLLPGVEPQLPEQSSTASWALPVGLAAAGLTGYALLRGAGRGIKGLLGRLRSARKAPEPWNWDMEMLGRGGSRYQSMLHPGQSVGHGYGPGPEAIVKTSSLDILRTLGRIAGER